MSDKGAVREAMQILNDARDMVIASAEDALEAGLVIKAILGVQPIEIEKEGLVVSIRLKSERKNGGKKGRQLRYEGKDFPSARSLCDFLGHDVGSDSAVRVLEKHKVSYEEI